MRRWIVMPVVLVILSSSAALGAKRVPEYMKVKPRVGLSLEVEGQLNADGLFVASDVEVLDEARRPKLRAPIEALDAANSRLRILGIDVQVNEGTDFDSGDFSRLARGQYVEVKCSVGPDGRWAAASIQTLQVKRTTKVKVTLTRVAVDGTSPDTVEVSGFRILLVEQTDVNALNEPPSSEERARFRQLAHRDASSMQQGAPFANNRVNVEVEYRQNLENWTDPDLSSTFGADSRETQPETRMRIAAFANPRLRAITELRIRRGIVLESDLGQTSGDTEAGLLQLAGLWREIGGRPVAAEVGRVRIKEAREWLYDEYLGAARFFAYPRRGFFEATFIDGSSGLKSKSHTWTDLIATVGVPLGDGTASLYAWRRWDSDETRNREPLWTGLRYFGEPVSAARAWGDFALMRGDDKGRALNAWAIDLGATLRADRVPLLPALTLAYAVGSGNPQNAGNTDHRFRQSGYEDNSSRLGGVASVRYYGAALNPELSNLKITTAAVAVRPNERGSIELLWHRYSQHHPDDEVRGGLIDPPARPNGVDPNLGDALDVVLGLSGLWDHLHATWTLAWYFPGDAYLPRQETAFLNRVEVRLEL